MTSLGARKEVGWNFVVLTFLHCLILARPAVSDAIANVIFVLLDAPAVVAASEDGLLLMRLTLALIQAGTVTLVNLEDGNDFCKDLVNLVSAEVLFEVQELEVHDTWRSVGHSVAPLGSNRF